MYLSQLINCLAVTDSYKVRQEETKRVEYEESEDKA